MHPLHSYQRHLTEGGQPEPDHAYFSIKTHSPIPAPFRLLFILAGQSQTAASGLGTILFASTPFFRLESANTCAPASSLAFATNSSDPKGFPEYVACRR